MPPLPTIANVYRVTLNWAPTGSLRGAHNVIHIRAAASDEAEVAADLDDAVQPLLAANNPFAVLDGDYECVDIDVMKLDGVSAQQTFVNAGGPWTGGGTGEELFGLAGVVSLHTTQRGPRGRGRVFVGPTSEGELFNGLFPAGTAGGVPANWQMLQDNLAGFPVTKALVVASYVHADAHDVTSFSMSRVVGHQRRREPQA